MNIDPLDIEQILMIAELPKDSPTLVAGCVIRFSRPYDRDSILPALRKESTPGLLPSLVKPSPAAMVPSMLYRRANGPKGYSFAMPDDRTLLMAPDEMLQRMVAQKKKHTVGPLSRALKGADFSDDSMIFVAFEPLRSAIKKASEEARISPKYRQQVELWQEVPDLISLTELRLSVVGSKHRFLLSIHTIDEASTVKLQRLINKILDLGEQTTLAEAAEQAARNPDSNSPTHQALRQYSERTTKQMFNALRPVRRGDRLEIGTKGPHVNPLTVGLVLGSIGSYVKMGMLAQEQREKTRDNDS
ncbi:MAG: hypothetical protein JW818_20450 [Pirellulales bacterium]|nr:hypothetical protein [Pirellulales bacterium]